MPNTETITNNASNNEEVKKFTEFVGNIQTMRKVMQYEHEMNDVYGQLIEDLVKNTPVTVDQYNIMHDALDKIEAITAEMKKVVSNEV